MGDFEADEGPTPRRTGAYFPDPPGKFWGVLAPLGQMTGTQKCVVLK